MKKDKQEDDRYKDEERHWVKGQRIYEVKKIRIQEEVRIQNK